MPCLATHSCYLEHAALGLAAACGFTTLALYPVLVFIGHGWKIKKADIFSSFTSSAKILYLQTFLKWKPPAAGDNWVFVADSSTSDDQKNANAEFERLYITRYGRHRFVGPATLFFLVCMICMFLFSEAGLAQILIVSKGVTTPLGNLSCACFISLPPVAAAGIGGAYVWIVADFITQTRRLDFAPSDVLNGALRLAIAAALAYAVVGIVKDAVGLPLAFALGAFPLETVRTILRRFATEKLNLGIGVDDQWSDQIINLDSVDHPIADRLLDADITTIAELAYADPVQLAMRTGLSFDFVVDLVSQALAWAYLDDRLDDLRSAGLRGAMEIRYFLQDLSGRTGPARQAMAEALLAIAPGLPKDLTKNGQTIQRQMLRPQFLNACDQIANDPNTIFLTEVWNIGHSGDSEIALNIAFN